MTFQQPSDRRQFGRRASRTDAYIVVDGRAPTPCVLLNFSDNGAFLQVPDAFSPPPNFRLVIAEQRIDVTCQMRHRTQAGIGIRFTGGSIAPLLAHLGQAAAVPTGPRPAAAPTRSAQSQPRASGVDLRAALIGKGDAGATVEVRSIQSDPGRIIRGI